MIYDKATIGGGASKIAIQSAIELAKNPDNNVIFFAANSEIDECLIENHAVKVVCIDTPLIADNKNKIEACMYGVWNKMATKALSELLANLDPRNTIIHIHGWTKALSVSIIACALKKKFPVLVTLHDYFSVCPNGGFYNYRKKELCYIKPLSMKCLSCNCDKRSYFQKLWRCLRQVVQNRYVMKNYNIHYAFISNRILNLSKPYLKSNNFHYLRNPIDLSDHMTLDHHSSNIFLCAGRVSEEKGVEDFCRAMTKVQTSHDIRGQVVGVGPLLESLKMKYPNIDFIGWVNNTQLAEFYGNARMLVFPSICNEGSPLTIPEALSAGLPCIVTDCTSAVETIENGVNGLVYAAGNFEDLVEKVNQSLNNELVVSFQMNIKDTFKCDDYNYAAYVNSADSLYEEILMENK